jgi:hypothetical protein
VPCVYDKRELAGGLPVTSARTASEKLAGPCLPAEINHLTGQLLRRQRFGLANSGLAVAAQAEPQALGQLLQLTRSLLKGFRRPWAIIEALAHAQTINASTLRGAKPRWLTL